MKHHLLLHLIVTSRGSTTPGRCVVAIVIVLRSVVSGFVCATANVLLPDVLLLLLIRPLRSNLQLLLRCKLLKLWTLCLAMSFAHLAIAHVLLRLVLAVGHLLHLSLAAITLRSIVVHHPKGL